MGVSTTYPALIDDMNKRPDMTVVLDDSVESKDARGNVTCNEKQECIKNIGSGVNRNIVLWTSFSCYF